MKLSLKDNFCSSPWFHLRVDPNGDYLPCRWGSPLTVSDYNISNTSLTDYLKSDQMNQYRNTLLNGESPNLCHDCQYEQNQGKVSGRQRQLLKSGIIETDFNKTFCASPHWSQFEYSYNNQGQTNTWPVDLQIDLGNTCNSACIMCWPKYSTRVAEDHKKLKNIEPILFKNPREIKNWTNNEILIEKFVNELRELPTVKYIHFLGGETLYIKSFYDICNQMIDSGLAKETVMGTTTNCTVYDERIEHVIRNFKAVHLGLSVEAVTPVNDYIRWPSKIDSVLNYVNRFLELRQHHNLFLSLRITPNIFSIYHLDQMLEFMINNQIIAESCNILSEPSCLRMELLPNDLRQQVIDKLNSLVKKYELERPWDKIINRRVPEKINSVISDVIFEYIDFLEKYESPDNIEEDRQNLVKFLNAYESIHNNKILDYLPEYEEFLRSIGYQA